MAAAVALPAWWGLERWGSALGWEHIEMNETGEGAKEKGTGSGGLLWGSLLVASWSLLPPFPVSPPAPQCKAHGTAVRCPHTAPQSH